MTELCKHKGSVKCVTIRGIIGKRLPKETLACLACNKQLNPQELVDALVQHTIVSAIGIEASKVNRDSPTYLLGLKALGWIDE